MINNNNSDDKKVTVLNEDIKSRINYEKEQIVRPNKKNGLGKIQFFSTIVMGFVVLFGIIYSLLAQLK
ncbi:hypothetical protein KIJ05_01415 [Leuconostoc gelidum subsp. gasicomitatum]|uniref:hypothetical protein n=1 Tax=Leuconostoc gasicomitatum TaxID=115778 RepID=UPI001CC53384|nr:hypothetical protein [Leuconostoc gasicomitatum]MBZ5983797.1 hypothetical protein [Leuconostoc gasicomitatum]